MLKFLTKRKGCKTGMKLYIAELDAFNHKLTAVARSEKQAVNAVMREYSAEYKWKCGITPGKSIYEVKPRRSRYAVMKDEVKVTEVKEKEVLWRER